MQYKINPELANQAKSQNKGGAYRVWMLARWLDPQGSGTVKKILLRSALTDFGVEKRTGQRWIKAAIETGFISTRKELDYYRYQSPDKIARILNVRSLGRPVLLEDPKEIFKTDWGILIFDCQIASGEKGSTTGFTASRATIKEISGVAERTQRSYIKKGKTRAKRNVSIIKKDASERYHDIGGKIQLWGSWLVRIDPSTHTSPYSVGARGRIKKQNRILANLVNSVGQGRIEKRYYHSWKSAIKQGREVLLFRKNYRDTNYWQVLGGNIA